MLQVRGCSGPTADVVADVMVGSDFGGWLEVLHRGGRYVTAGAIAGPSYLEQIHEAQQALMDKAQVGAAGHTL